jgi:hypothetical protein
MYHKIGFSAAGLSGAGLVAVNGAIHVLAGIVAGTTLTAAALALWKFRPRSHAVNHHH